MLDFFRQKGLTSIVYAAVIVATMLVFVVGFNPSAGKKLGSMNEACAARVRGSCIEPKTHRAAYRLVFSRGTGGMKQALASRIVLEGLIERELLAAEAARLGLTVAEGEITDSIFRGFIHVSLPSDNVTLQQNLGFEDGRVRVTYFNDPKTKTFDLKAYERNVKQLTGRSPTEFREWQGRELLASKMRDLVRAPVRVADDEAFDRYVAQKTNAVVSYLVVRRSWIEKYGITSDAKDVDAWAKDKTNLTNVKTNVRHILVGYRERGGPPPTPEKKEAAKKKADDIYARVKKGEDFGKLAKELSDDPGSKDKGGEYDAKMMDGFHPKFGEAYGKLAPGEVTDGPIEIEEFGFHVIKKNEASKDEIARAYKESRSLEISKKMAQAVIVDVKAGKPGEEAIKAAIDRFAIVKVAPRPAEPKPEAKGDAGATATATAADAGPPPPPVTADADPERPQLLTSSPFNRGGKPIVAISDEAAENVGTFAFSAKEGDVTPEPLRTDDGFLVVQVKELKPATRADFDKERDTFVQQLVANKQAEALAQYVRRLRQTEKAEVKIDENNVFGAKSDAGPARDDDDEGP